MCFPALLHRKKPLEGDNDLSASAISCVSWHFTRANMSSTVQSKRPLSPHLAIYKPIPTMVTSILHRITGVALYLGTLLVAWWLIAAATGPAYFDYVSMIFGSLIGKIILFGFTWALMLHMLGGIKHLIWDTGRLIDKGTSTKLAYASLFLASTLSVLIWAFAFFVRH
jgi:succinate dehydrogenase / fumarate reductase, cytochrome b subunit